MKIYTKEEIAEMPQDVLEQKFYENRMLRVSSEKDRVKSSAQENIFTAELKRRRESK